MCNFKIEQNQHNNHIGGRNDVTYFIFGHIVSKNSSIYIMFSNSKLTTHGQEHVKTHCYGNP